MLYFFINFLYNKYVIYMEEKINEKIDELILLLDKDPRIKDILLLKDKILNNKKLISKISKLKEMDIYSKDYLMLKKELFSDKEFCLFKEKETEIDYLILMINKKLNSLVNKRGCLK